MQLERLAPPLRLTRAPLAIAVVLLAGSAATLVLPYFFPVAPVISESYLLGFNNQACFVIFVTFALFFSWWTGGFGLRSPEVERDGISTRPALVLLLGVTIAFFGVTLIEWLRIRAHPAMSEAMYLLDRLQHLQAGELPFLQFEFAYGPLLLYAPLLISRVCHVSVSDAYYISWIVEYVVGVAIVYGAVALLPVSRSQKNVIFLLLACSWWAGPLSFGCNYTPIRYFLAPLLVLVGARRIRSQASPFGVSVELLIGEVLVLLVSPEQALAFVAAILVFTGYCYFRSRSSRLIVTGLAFALGSGLVLSVCNRLGVFLTLNAMRRGGYNFPLLPVVQHVPIVVLLLVGAAGLVNHFRRKGKPNEVEMLLLLGLFALPAAFGRSDIGHFLVNSTPALMAAWCILAQYPKFFRSMAVAYTVLVLLLPAPGILAGAARAQKGDRGTTLMRSEANGQDGASAPLAPLGRPLANSPALAAPVADTGYYYGLLNVTLPFQVEQKVREMAADPERDLLLPNEFSCTSVLDREALRRTLSTVYVPTARRTSEIYDPICSYIQIHYRRSDGVSPYQAYRIWHSVHLGKP